MRLLVLMAWKVYHAVKWLQGPTYKGVLLDDYRRWKETGEWSDRPPKGWPWKS